MILAFLALLTACGGGTQQLVLDGRPRMPDAEGVVEKISATRITLDGGRSYGVRGDLQSFSTYDLAPVPMLHRLGQYVQLGLDGDNVAWMAGVGLVVRASPAPPVVFYNGRLVRIDSGRRAIFRDGTVLLLAPGVRSTVDEGLVRAEIDPSRHRVSSLVGLSS